MAEEYESLLTNEDWERLMDSLTAVPPERGPTSYGVKQPDGSVLYYPIIRPFSYHSVHDVEDTKRRLTRAMRRWQAMSPEEQEATRARLRRRKELLGE